MRKRGSICSCDMHGKGVRKCLSRVRSARKSNNFPPLSVWAFRKSFHRVHYFVYLITFISSASYNTFRHILDLELTHRSSRFRASIAWPVIGRSTSHHQTKSLEHHSLQKFLFISASTPLASRFGQPWSQFSYTHNIVIHLTVTTTSSSGLQSVIASNHGWSDNSRPILTA